MRAKVYALYMIMTKVMKSPSKRFLFLAWQGAAEASEATKAKTKAKTRTAMWIEFLTFNFQFTHVLARPKMKLFYSLGGLFRV